MTIPANAAAGACALLFLAAALGKFDSWRSWSRLTEEIPGPVGRGRALRVMVPGIETGVVVLSFAWPIVGLAAGATVLGVFAVGIWLLARRLGGRECNCFGAIAPATISHRLAYRNVALAVLVTAGWYAARHERLHALSLGAVLLTLIAGAVGLMLLQYRRLRLAARPPSPSPREVK